MAGKWLPSAAGLAAAASLFVGLGSGALWDPHELSVAELSRRIALNLLGGVELAIAGADNSVPIRAELGRGELPLTSAALGFRALGLSEWAGRLPLALWSALALGVFYAALTRLWDRRVALYGVLVLASTPLFFLQARTLLGDAVTLATFTIAWSGLTVATSPAPQSMRARVLFGALGLVGLYAGFWCRGPIVNVAVPALSVGLASRLTLPSHPLARLLGVALLALGAVALTLGVLGLSLAERTAEYSVFVGSALRGAGAGPISFDASLAALLHSLFPWSGLAPLALSLVVREGTGQARRAATHAAVLSLAGSLAAAVWLLPALGLVLLPAACCFALLVAGALRELELSPRPLPVLGLSCAALTVLLGLDLITHADKPLSGFNLRGAELPAGLVARSELLWKWGALAIAAVTALCFYEAEGRSRPSFRRREYGVVLARLQRTWDGNLVFAALVLEAALVGFLLLSAISERFVHLEQLDSFGATSRRLVAAAAVALPCSGLIPLAALTARDLARRVFSSGRLAPTRAQGVLCVAALLGFTASLDFYPRLAEQVAPKKVFERYRELGRAGEPLAMVGEGAIAARYQAGATAEQLASTASALAWLVQGGPEAPRRWLLIQRSALAELNALFRESRRRNLPILDARSSELLLASNQLRAGERDESPLRSYVLDQPPRVQHALRAVLERRLELIGWSLVDSAGRHVTRVSPAAPYRLIIYWRVLAPLRGDWQTFVHLDGLQRRFNADHVPLGEHYPISAWRSGDILVDSTELVLEPNFTPGVYRLYFGLFNAERRLGVTEGPAADDRIVAGAVQVD